MKHHFYELVMETRVCRTEPYRPVRTVRTGSTGFRYVDRLLPVRGTVAATVVL